MTRAIVLAMPITLVLLGLMAAAIFPGLTWAEAFLLAAVLTPTDPVVTSTVVTAQRVPVDRPPHAEPGVGAERRPGAALRALLPRPRAAGRRRRRRGREAPRRGRLRRPRRAWCSGLLGGRLHHHLPGGGITARYEGIYAIGFGLAAFGLADVTIGNGLIAAFVAGIAMGVAEHEIPDAFVEFAENVSAIFQVITFFVFGALIVATGYDGEIWRLVVFILAGAAGRPAGSRSCSPSFAAGCPGPQKLFIAWFGPKGVASMLFALFVLKSDVGASTTIFDVAAFVILSSIVAHGLTDTVGATWIERRCADRASPGALAERPRLDRSAASFSTAARAVSSSTPVWVT